MHFVWNQADFKEQSTCHWEGESQERIERDADVSALEALHCALQLPVHEVDYDALVSGKECLPEDLAHFVVWPVVCCWNFNVRLLLHSVHILVEKIKNEVQKLTSILLAIARESGYSFP